MTSDVLIGAWVRSAARIRSAVWLFLWVFPWVIAVRIATRPDHGIAPGLTPVVEAILTADIFFLVVVPPFVWVLALGKKMRQWANR